MIVAADAQRRIGNDDLARASPPEQLTAGLQRQRDRRTVVG